jgi:hypothetical protein
MTRPRQLIALVFLAAVAPGAGHAAADPGSFDSLEAALEHPAEAQTLILKGPVPKDVERLSNLRALVASGPLPDEPLRLPRLTTLRLTGAKVTRIPEWVGSVTTLQTIDLSRAAITALPRSIGQLINLERLLVADTRLEALPAEIASLKKVKELRLTRDRALKALPAGIGGMESLETLAAAGTGLEAIPPEIGRCKRLRQADFSGSKLRLFPWEAFATMPALEELAVSDTPLKPPAKLGALESLGSVFRRAKGAPAPAPAAVATPTDPQAIKARILDLGKSGARDQLLRLLQDLTLVPRKNANVPVQTEDYLTAETQVDAEIFYANLLAEPAGAPVEKEAVLQVRTSGDPATTEYYALALFNKAAGAWHLAGTIIEDGRSTAGPYFTFAFVPLFKKPGVAAIRGIIQDMRLGGNERSETKSVAIWKMQPDDVVELVHETYSDFAYQSAPYKVRKDESGSFRLDIQPDSASLIVKQRKDGKEQTRTVKVY